tara:strand:- start:220 stop:462 length:243 start_codon:yes stop_codon:yes gene_type:complete
MITIDKKFDKISEWSNNRKKDYKDIRGQLDMLYDDMKNDKLNTDGEWYKAIKKVKDDNPKPNNLEELKQELADLIIEDNA